MNCTSTLRGIFICERGLGRKDSGFFSSEQIQRTPVPPSSPQVTLQIQLPRQLAAKTERERCGVSPYYTDEKEDEENEKWVGP